MPRPPKEPPLIPGYEILEPLGSGGQGSVWRARQKSLDRIVAIKVLWAEDASDPVLSQRFIEEARIAGLDTGVLFKKPIDPERLKQIILARCTRPEPDAGAATPVATSSRSAS